MSRPAAIFLLLSLALGLGLGVAAQSGWSPSPPQGGPCQSGDGPWLALPGLEGRPLVVSGLAAQGDGPSARLLAYWRRGPAFPVQAGPGASCLRWAEPGQAPPAGLLPGSLLAVQGPGGLVAARRVIHRRPDGAVELDQALPPGLMGGTAHLLADPGGPAGAEIPLGRGRLVLFSPGGLFQGPAGSPVVLGVQGREGSWVGEVVWGFGPRSAPEATNTTYP